jgi:Tfp pilus assembly protein PilE
MFRQNNSGFTLAELTTAVVVASISVMIMLGAYEAINRIWHKGNNRVEAVASVWQVYLKMASLFEKSHAVVGCPEGSWIFLEKSDTVTVKFTGSSLYFDSTQLNTGTVIKRFSLNIAGYSDNNTIWECAVTCSLSGVTRELCWRTIPRAVIMADKIPVHSENAGQDSAICFSGGFTQK